MVTVDEMLEAARARLDRVPVESLAAEVAAGAIVVDIRGESFRRRDGDLPGAMVLERNVLEWRFCPASEHRVADVQPGQRVIIMCDEGYQSSLAAATLQDLGIDGATDLIGGYQAYLKFKEAKEA